MQIDDLQVITQEIYPPLPGGEKHAGEVQYLFVVQDGKRKRISHEFGETRGETEAEAEAVSQMRVLVEKWVASQ